MFSIKQGDAYALPIKIYSDHEPVETVEDIDTVEVYFGSTSFKEWKKDGTGAITFEDGVFYFSLNQEETFALQQGPMFLDVRVKFTDGSTIGVPDKIRVDIKDAVSTRVL